MVFILLNFDRIHWSLRKITEFKKIWSLKTDKQEFLRESIERKKLYDRDLKKYLSDRMGKTEADFNVETYFDGKLQKFIIKPGVVDELDINDPPPEPAKIEKPCIPTIENKTVDKPLAQKSRNSKSPKVSKSRNQSFASRVLESNKQKPQIATWMKYKKTSNIQPKIPSLFSK